MDPQSSIIQHLTSGYMANIIKCPRIMIKSGSLWPLHINYFSLSTDNVVSCTTTQLKQEWINLTKAVKLLKVHYLFCIAKVLAFKKFRMGGQSLNHENSMCSLPVLFFHTLNKNICWVFFYLYHAMLCSCDKVHNF